MLCPALSWPSPAHAIRVAGAKVRFVDVDQDEWNSTGRGLPRSAERSDTAAIVIDQFGNPARAQEIREALGLLPIIEDAACAFGSRFASGPCGSLGVVSCLSFHPRKILTTGEGGMCLTDDDDIADKLRTLRNHGQLGGQFVVAAGNSRMTEIAAALGLAQLQRLDDIFARRRAIAALYRRRSMAPWTFKPPRPARSPNYQTFGALLPQGYARDAVRDKLRERGVEAGFSLLPFTSSAASPAATHRCPSPSTWRRGASHFRSILRCETPKSRRWSSAFEECSMSDDLVLEVKGPRKDLPHRVLSKARGGGAAGRAFG